MAKSQPKTEVNHADNSTKRVKRGALPPSLAFIIVAIVASAGYVAGTFHQQIIAAVGPVFGYHAHSGSLDLSSVQDVYRALAANFDGKLDDQALIQGASKGLVEAAGDQYTIYMTPSESSSFDDNLTGNIGGGIGAEIGLRNDQVTIIRTLKGNPAEKAGLGAGDVILKVNDESASGWTVEKAVSVIRGEEGTTVKLTIDRAGEVKDYSITRAIIISPSVEGEVKGGIGFLTISRFDGETSNQARLVAQSFVNKKVKAIILDLRGNGGGYLSAASDIAGLWLVNQVVVTEQTGGKVTDTIKSGDKAILAGIPTVVLVNAGTASASEILAGALHDHKVAKLVGEQTYGKGSVQKLIDLTGGAELKVTVARWYTPAGVNITKDGIKPDFAASLTQADVNAGRDPQIDKAKQVLGL